MTRAYLAGPDVFLPNAREHIATKIGICAGHGIEGIASLDDAPARTWRDIYDHNLALMQFCDLVIANLTPFRGASADAGTLVEIGWFLGRALPVYGYSNSSIGFEQRSRRQLALSSDPIPGTAIEAFDLHDNLMIAGACTTLELPRSGEIVTFDSLALFERCVERIHAISMGAII